jgi:outer membrane protein assembly factor BamB
MKNLNFGNKKMKAATIALILLLAVSALSMVCLPPTEASDVAVEASIGIAPNPIGINQPVTVNLWLLPITPTGDTVFHGFELTITKPDGNTETKGPYTSYSIGSVFLTYTPDQLGVYKFQFTYPGETILGMVYKPATSPVTELVVQADPIQPLPGVAPPTDYWTRPINAENREWASISGDWLMMAYNGTGKSATDSLAAYNPYSQAPKSSHIAWTIPQGFGGIVGGDFGSTSYYTGLSYEADAPVIIMNGRLYYHENYKTMGNQTLVCVDLRSGEEYWRKDITIPGLRYSGTSMTPSPQDCLTCGQLLNYQTGNQMGVIPYLWTTGHIYSVYDPFTGDLICQFANATAVSKSGNNIVFDENGNMLVYVLNAANGWFLMWNSTKCFENNGLTPAYTSGMQTWRPMPGVYDWQKGIVWNKTITPRPPETLSPGNSRSLSLQPICDNILVGYYGTSTNLSYHIGYNIDTGEEIWAFDRMDDKAHQLSHFSAFGYGQYSQWDAAQRSWYTYDLQTGKLKWVSEKTDYPYGAYMGNSLGGVYAYDKLYSMGYDGKVYAFDAATGKIAWRFYCGDSGFETPYGSWPLFGGPIIADNVVFANNGEHSPNQPLYRGEKLYAMDANTGHSIWNISGWQVLHAIADGYLITINNYDNQMYCFGKGKSATTVSAPDEVQPFGKAVMIKGTVTDQSSAQKGTPAVSDDSMSAWMEYLHMQKPKPTNATGVEVSLAAVDPNGNYKPIGTTTSDSEGLFSYKFIPEVPGRYTIIAEFAGSESYGSSSAETIFYVDEEPVATTAPEILQPIDNTPVIIGVGVAVIIAVAIATLLILRKKP